MITLDEFAKEAITTLKANHCFDMPVLFKNYPELLEKGVGHQAQAASRKNSNEITYTIGSVGTVVTNATGNGSIVTNFNPQGSNPINVNNHMTKLRITMKEIAHNWSSILHEQFLQIHMLQAVLHKKVDPTTHIKFAKLLSQLLSHSESNEQVNLLNLFCTKLATAMQETMSEKAKLYPLACTRLYPALRCALLDSLSFIRVCTVV